MPNPENAQLIPSLYLSFNLEDLAAFAWQEYQRLGKGVVVIDQVRPYALYWPRSFVADLPDDALPISGQRWSMRSVTIQPSHFASIWAICLRWWLNRLSRKLSAEPL